MTVTVIVVVVMIVVFMVMNDAYYNDDDDDRNDDNDDSSCGGCGVHDDCKVHNKMLFCIPVFLLFWRPKLGSGICFFLNAIEVMMIM